MESMGQHNHQFSEKIDKLFEKYSTPATNRVDLNRQFIRHLRNHTYGPDSDEKKFKEEYKRLKNYLITKKVLWTLFRIP